jgi:phosphate transport system substrate-binding protein
MRFTTLAFFGFILLTGGAAADSKDGILRLGGSTTLLPVISKASSDFMERFDTWNRVDPSFPERDVVIFVSGGGSSFGVKSAINGTVEIGLVSRYLKNKEKTLLGEYRTFQVGTDAVAIAVNKDNPLARLRRGFSSDEMASIFSGAVRTYRDFDATLPDESIVLFVRDSGAGSAEMIQKLILHQRPVSSGALQLSSQGALLQKLNSNPRAVGYISSGLLLASDRLVGLALDGVRPSNENVINSRYPVVRPLMMVVKGEPGALARAFIDYVLGEHGQALVASLNYVPMGKNYVPVGQK